MEQSSVAAKVRAFFERVQRIEKNKDGTECVVEYDACKLKSKRKDVDKCETSYKVCTRGSTTNMQRHVFNCHSAEDGVKSFIAQLESKGGL